MLLLSCQKLKKSFNNTTVLKEISFDLGPADRVGLIGKNGSGKTTLAEIIAGEQSPDHGQLVFHQKNLKIGYLRQGREKNNSGGDFPGGFLATSKKLGLEKVYLWEEERWEKASGGERTKLALARIWNKNPDLLVLDEPTNHLDEQGITWLIEQLKNFPGALLVISHDRFFLDQVTEKTLELKDGKVTIFPGNFSFYREEKAHQKKTQKRAFEKERREQKKLKTEITRTKNWAQSGHDRSREKSRENKKGGKEFFRARAAKKERQAQSKIKRLEKLSQASTPRPGKNPELNIDLAAPQKRGRRIVEIQEGKKGYSGRDLFCSSSFYLLRGEKTALRGPNGCGKSTLLRIFSGEDNLDQGNFWLSPSANIGFLPQEEKLPLPGETGTEILFSFAREKKEWFITLLARMGFGRELLNIPLCSLSYGERRRFQLCHLLLKEPDLLLLDEPTTHLDLSLREGLERALKSYRGTLVMVCHDRYLVDSLCSTKLLIEKQKITKKPLKEEQTSTPPEEDLMVIETRISKILGELGQVEPDSLEYQELDQEFQKLVQVRKKIKAGKNPRP